MEQRRSIQVIRGSEKDNVVTCCEIVGAGDQVRVGGVTVAAAEDIPIYHKMAISNISAGEYVFKYGQPIGVASKDILAGQHVHVQNLESDRGRGDRERRPS